MGYKIQWAYCWYNNKSQIVKMYFIEGIPFTFDELADDVTTNPSYIALADKERSYEVEDLYRTSFYLIDEEVHPMLFPIDIENPEELPEDCTPDSMPD